MGEPDLLPMLSGWAAGEGKRKKTAAHQDGIATA
jgi:hypothetical protein